MMVSQKLVIPAKAGMTSPGNHLKKLGSRFHGYDEKGELRIFFDVIFNDKAQSSNEGQKKELYSCRTLKISFLSLRAEGEAISSHVARDKLRNLALH